MQRERVDVPRLLERVQYYAQKAGASPDSISSLLEMLASPLGQSILQLAETPVLTSLLNNDLYKVHMQNMYAQFMTGVTADFALNIRKCQRFSSSGSSSGSSSTGSSSNNSGGISPAAYVLADIRREHPEIFSELSVRISHELQSCAALDPSVLGALEEFNEYTPTQALLSRAAAVGVAAVEWVDIEGAPVAVGSGPIESASNTETSVMQAVQAAVIAAAAAHHRQQHCTPAEAQTQQHHNLAPEGAADGSSGGSSEPQQQQQQQQQQWCCGVLDRTERLSNSIGRMVWTVEQLNDILHDFDIMLMAGRRSTDLLHLLLQNLYFMKHVRGYKGTSSLLACAVLRRVLQQQGVDAAGRRRLVGRVMGTHAHEMTSMTQQLMGGYDEEAGRRCGLKVPVCISQLLSHILFLTANGGSSSSSSSEQQHPEDSHTHPPSNTASSSSSSSRRRFVGGTALPDTFTTPYFVLLSSVTSPPPEFIADMAERWGVEVEAGDKVFDLFSVWRLDSGSYPDLAQLIYDTWTKRNEARAAVGMSPLPPLKLLHSNISTLDDIRELVSLPPHIRPSMLGFGGLADGFMPFDIPAPQQQQQQQSSDTAPPGTAAAAAAGVPVSVSLPNCSLVMKAVQARPPPASTQAAAATLNININSSSSNAAAAAAAAAGPLLSPSHSAAAAGVADPTPHPSCSSHPLETNPPTLASPPPPPATAAATSPPPATQPTPAAAAAAAAACVRQACCVKLGDGGLSKAQTDPRLPPEVRAAVLTRLQEMVTVGREGQQQQQQLQCDVLSDVLREAYVAVVRQGVLMDEGRGTC